MKLDGDNVSLTGEDIIAIMHNAFMVVLGALDEANVLSLRDAARALENDKFNDPAVRWFFDEVTRTLRQPEFTVIEGGKSTVREVLSV